MSASDEPGPARGGSPGSSLGELQSGFYRLGNSVSNVASSWLEPQQAAIRSMKPHYKRPSLQRRMLSAASPKELIRSTLSPSDLQFRALTYLPDELLAEIPEASDHEFSLIEGFTATLADSAPREGRPGQRQLHLHSHFDAPGKPRSLRRLHRERDMITREHEVIRVRKALTSSEIREVDSKIKALQSMRSDLIERLERLEIQEGETSNDLLMMDKRILEREEQDEVAKLESETGISTPNTPSQPLMSDSIYGKLASTKSRKKRALRRKSTPILHEHFGPGSHIKTIQAHLDEVTALDFDMPFGTMVTASTDENLSVWNMASGKCIGLLEGHTASIRAVRVNDQFVATASNDATVRFWDLSLSEIYTPGADYEHVEASLNHEEDDFATICDLSLNAPADCCVHNFSDHLGEVTALHFQGKNLVSGGEDKTIRQYDLESGRLVQTLDILWAAAQYTAISPTERNLPQSLPKTTRPANANFVGALQCFDAALATGTADGYVRLWDLRSGQVHRTLVGHTGPVTALQFDERHLITGSADRSVRIWDLRMGNVYDAFAYDSPITDLHIDPRRIATCTSEPVVRMYDRVSGNHWACGGIQGDGVPEVGDAGIGNVKSKEGVLVAGRLDGKISMYGC